MVKKYQIKKYVDLVNPLTAEWVLRALRDFTLANARRFYSSMGNPLVKGVEDVVKRKRHSFENQGTRTGWTRQITKKIL